MSARGLPAQDPQRPGFDHAAARAWTSWVEALPDRLQAAAAVLMLAAGVWYLGDAAWMQGKALLAQVLIERAWAGNQADGSVQQRPWSWADTTPVGRLEFVRQRKSMIVLAGDSGRVLAFGPGHRPGSAMPGGVGNSVISAHRDTHFAVLESVALGDAIRVETVEGRTLTYRVDQLDIVDEHDLSVTEQRGFDQLTLVTCWPFNAIAPGGPLRYVVSASRNDAAASGLPPAARSEAGSMARSAAVH